MPKRSVIIGALLLAMFSGLMIKIYHLADSGLAQVADQQSTVTVTVATARGTIYDRNMQPLVNTGTQNRVSVAPYPVAVAALSEALAAEEFEALAARLQSGRPVTLTLDRLLAPTEGISQFSVPVRYGEDLAAPHLLGYLDGDELHGVTGIELAFDEYLNSKSGSIKVTYKVDGSGKPLQGIAPEIQNTLDDARAGVVLSIDREIQYIAEQAAKKHIDRGAVVVLEPATGQVLAMVSLPDFQQDTLVDALEDERSPLLNRALCNYNCGSVFKIVSAAAALEAGVPLNESYTCKGSINVGGIPFHCHNRLGHGVMSMVSGFAHKNDGSQEKIGYKGYPSGFAATERFDYNASNINATLGTAPMKVLFMTYAEVEFIKAEMAWRGLITDQAAPHYRKAVEAIIEQWGGVVPGDYFDNPKATYDGTLERILLQKHLAAFFCDYQAWFEYRRTGLPEMKPGAGMDNNKMVPVRFNYPATLQQTNKTNYEAAVKSLGGPDDINTKVWWEK